MKTPNIFTLLRKWAHGQRTSTASLPSLTKTKTELTCTFTQYTTALCSDYVVAEIWSRIVFFFLFSVNYIQRKTFHKHRWNSSKGHLLKISLHLCFGSDQAVHSPTASCEQGQRQAAAQWDFTLTIFTSVTLRWAVDKVEVLAAATTTHSKGTERKKRPAS